MSSKAEKAKRRKDQKEKAKGSESSAAVADGATLAMILSVCNTVLDGMDVFGASTSPARPWTRR